MAGVIGHEGVLRELRLLALSPEPPHALMLAGPVGTGRSLLARTYAALLNCETRVEGGVAPEPGGRELPCGECRACRLILAGHHPDLQVLEPGDSFCKARPDDAHEKHPLSRDIRICQVRGLIEALARFPFEARYRVVIIEPADLFGREAVQSMLKTLEEPPARNSLVLVTSAPEQLPETILSRCRRIDVRQVPRRVIEADLVERGVALDLAARAASAARGSPVRALAFAAQPDLMDDLGRLLERCAALAGANRGERLAYAADLAERWRRDRSLVAGELNAWEAFWERALRQAADGDASVGAGDALGALQAISCARQDLQDLVIARPALELMLLRFPKATMNGKDAPTGPLEEEPATYA